MLVQAYDAEGVVFFVWELLSRLDVFRHECRRYEPPFEGLISKRESTDVNGQAEATLIACTMGNRQQRAARR